MKSSDRSKFERELGENLRNARKAFGATQAILAECMDISRAQVANAEAGRGSLTPWGLHQFTQAMGIEIVDIWPKGNEGFST